MREKVILVIDDDDINLQIAKMVLERKLKNCRVICADSGHKGIEILREDHVDLVLLDILMPDFDGIETLTEIRADEKLKNTSVMMLTAANGIENLKKVYALGVKDYIKKPFLPADLISRVNKKFKELEPDEVILLLGERTDELQKMQTLIEKNFNYEVIIATSASDSQKILHENKIILTMANADINFIEGLKILDFLSKEEKLADVPFALTTSEKIVELLEKLKQPSEKTSPNVEKISNSVVVHKDKHSLAKVVTNLIGYELDVHV